jgi:hypothetical protein
VNGLQLVPDVELADGVLEADLTIPAERSFHGVAWRVQDELNYESFFLRPHQVGNPDSIQYTPVFNGLSAWQLYHGEGFGGAVSFPVGAPLTIRVAFAGERLQVQVDGEVVLSATRMRHVPRAGRLGVLHGGDGLVVHDVRWSAKQPSLPALPAEPRAAGAIRSWEVSESFREDELDAQMHAEHRWTTLEAEASGLVDLARVNGIEHGRNTVLARATVESNADRTAPLDLGFSDRATVYLNGEPLFHGSDGYRSRDYRFLGSIGWHDTVYLPLRAGANELVVAVAEDFGGWGIQARLRT